MIFEQRTFVDGAGRTIHGKYAVDEAESAPLFFAACVMNMPLPGGQVAQSQFQFEIPGATVAEAFENFQAALDQAKVKAEAQMREQLAGPKIIVPNSMPPKVNGAGRFHN